MFFASKVAGVQKISSKDYFRKVGMRIMPEMIFVDSSSIEAFGYDNDTMELHVSFLSGAYYIYSGVPREIFDSLRNVQSKGSFLERGIKNKFRFTKQW